MPPAVQCKYRLEEGATLFMLAGLNLAIIFSPVFYELYDIFFLNLILSAMIFFIAFLNQRRNTVLIILIRDWYILLILITVYFELKRLVPLINPKDVDYLLIEVDRILFSGQDPTVLLESVTFPALTEFLQIIYASFYLLPFSFCLFLYLKGRRKTFHIAASVIIIGFYISYAGYFLTPAVGPRYTLADLQNIELTGLWSFGFIRSMLDDATGVMRDCCPSGHTMLSLMTVFLALRYERGFSRIAIPWTLFLVFSTVYLRYHYFVDIIAGIFLAFLFLFAFPAIEKFPVQAAGPYTIISFSKMR
ncbi:MAG: phosphatase PAP2 family protein [Syntrophales bacterium]|nr:phosphatase PAP2 family protein [Syntrophales bacterium]MDY0045267.1 phosphatase PAP2 family protein [Syntrophales bacterium]